ncbi:MAG: ABC transporter substrate-binding protein [Anaerolineae bacterium]
MKPFRSIAGGVLLSLTILVTACAPTPVQPPDAQVTIVDALGRTVSWDAPPERMVISGKSNFMINDAIYLYPEALDRVVALTKARQTTTPFLSLLDSDYDDKVRFALESTAEEIATADPDVVFLKRFMRESVGNGLEALGIPVVYLDLETPEQYEREIALLGTIFGSPERAEVVWSFYQARLDRISEGLTDLQDIQAPTVLVVQYSSKGEEVALEVPPASWIQTQMVEIAGGDPVWGDASQGGWTVVNFEQIAAWNPDRIFVINYSDDVDAAVDRLASNPDWQALQAVQAGQLFGFPKDFYSWDQPDTRWILGLTWMATKMYPVQFEDVDMGEEIASFYGELYGLDPATVEAEVLPLLEGDVTP